MQQTTSDRSFRSREGCGWVGLGKGVAVHVHLLFESEQDNHKLISKQFEIGYFALLSVAVVLSARK